MLFIYWLVWWTNICESAFYFEGRILPKAAYRRKMYLAHNFSDFSPLSAGSFTFRPLTRQKHHFGRVWQRKVNHLMKTMKVKREGSWQASSVRESRVRSFTISWTIWIFHNFLIAHSTMISSMDYSVNNSFISLSLLNIAALGIKPSTY